MVEVSTKSALELAHVWTRQWDLPAEAEYHPSLGKGTLYPHKLSLESFVAGYEAACNRWISVEDRLPDLVALPFALCMTTTGFALGYYNRYLGCGWTDELGIETLIVTHWMPLPKPPNAPKL